MNTADKSVAVWLRELADHTPTPGGGSAAALLTATSAALLSMVANFTKGPKYVALEARMTELLAELTALRASAVQLADDDAEAFAAVAAAYKLPRSTDDEKGARTAAIQEALRGATGPPVEVGRLAARLVGIAQELAETGNQNVISDVAVASTTARAALDSAIVNIDINRFQISDDDEQRRLANLVIELTEAVAEADYVTNAVRAGMS